VGRQASVLPANQVDPGVWTEFWHPTGLRQCDISALNHHLRRTLRNRGGYVYPIELVAQRLTART
jgi:hypothetical protein